MIKRSKSQRLSQRQSISSIQYAAAEGREPSEHALIAARHAFSRAQGAAGEMTPRRRPDSGVPNPLHYGTSENSDRGIRRQQSVRFAGPLAIPRRRSLGPRSQASTTMLGSSSASAGTSVVGALRFGTPKPIVQTTNAPVPAAYRPPSRSSSIGKGSVGKGTADSFVTALAYSEYYTKEDDIASTPSSYRRIRKTKSMLVPSQAPHVFYTNGSPQRPPTLRRLSSFATSKFDRSPEAPTLRGPKSMSFLRRKQSVNRDHNDQAVQQARDRFFHQATQQRLREQPSFLFRSKSARNKDRSSKSAQSGSSNLYGIPIASADQQDSAKESSLKKKARKVSTSLKEKLRRVFTRSKDEPIEIPNQQIEAQETHVRQYSGDHVIDSGMPFIDVPHPGEATLSRVAARVPSRSMTPTQQPMSHNGSLLSLNSIEEKSRVTSWTSTGVNTVASHSRVLSERLNRLSVINESGTHISKASFSRPGLPTNPSAAYPAFHRPSKSAGHIPLRSDPVDSARLCSALMKRLDENSPKAKLEAARQASTLASQTSRDNSQEINASPVTRRSPRRSISVASRTPTTIRHVTEGSTSSEGTSTEHGTRVVSNQSTLPGNSRKSREFSNPWIHHEPEQQQLYDQDDVFSPQARLTPDHGFDFGQQQYVDVQPTHTTHAVPRKRLSAQQLASQYEHIDPPTRVIHQARSSFFGGSTSRIARTQSPYRRALAESDYKESIAKENVPLRNRTSYTNLRMKLSDSSPSAYSRATDDTKTIVANSRSTHSKSTESLPIEHPSDFPLQISAPGDAVVLERAVYRPTMPAGIHRISSEASSVEWKTFMSTEVAKLEKVKENNSPSHVNYALPTMPQAFTAGHVREKAQMSDDDTDVMQRRSSHTKQPLGMIQQNSQLSLNTHLPLKPILKKSSVESVSVKNFPSNIPIPPPLPPPFATSPRSPLRSIQSRSSLRPSLRTTPSVSRLPVTPGSGIKSVQNPGGKNVLHKRNVSGTTLRSTKSLRSLKSTGETQTPNKLQKRDRRQSLAGSERSRSKTPGLRVVESPEGNGGIHGSGFDENGEMRDEEAQKLGSAAMVEMFLSSRRKRIASGSEGEGSVFI